MRTGVRVLWLILLAGAPSLFADVPESRILIVGDSWAASIATTHHDPVPPGFGSFEAMLLERGYGHIRTVGSRTAWSGRKASDWAKPEHLAIIGEEIQRYPDIDFVHLIIGGNDFLTLLQENPVDQIRIKSAEERTSLFWKPILDDIQKIIESALQARKDLRVLLADYDYLDPRAMEMAYNFDFQGASTAEVNGWLEELGAGKRRLVDELNAVYPGRVYYLAHWGVLQARFGSGEKGREAGIPPAAQVGDGVHPNDAGHRALLEHAFETYYKQWLDEPQGSSAPPDRGALPGHSNAPCGS